MDNTAVKIMEAYQSEISVLMKDKKAKEEYYKLLGEHDILMAKECERLEEALRKVTTCKTGMCARGFARLALGKRSC